MRLVVMTRSVQRRYLFWRSTPRDCGVFSLSRSGASAQGSTALIALTRREDAARAPIASWVRVIDLARSGRQCKRGGTELGSISTSRSAGIETLSMAVPALRR